MIDITFDTEIDLLGLYPSSESVLLRAVDDDKKKKIFKKIVGYVLAYNTIPTALIGSELYKNTTYATNLTLSDGSLGGEALRLRIDGVRSFIRPSVNIFSSIVNSIVTKNGMRSWIWLRR
jgi:hypothetical protein